MANLTYNPNIFTNINKYDKDHNYRGIFVTGKFNQKNGQDFKILDAIDIDWDGAYVQKLNTYFYTTEDVINAFNLLGTNDETLNDYLNDNFVTYSYLYDNHYNKDEINNIIDENKENIIDTILGPVNENYNTLYKISEWIIDKSRYIKTDYINIVENGHLINDKDYYIYLGNNQYEKVNEEYILANPYIDYYEFVFNDVIDLSASLAELRNKIGEEVYNPITKEYTYSGIYINIHNLDDNINYLSERVDDIEDLLDITYTTSNNSYYLAYNAYITSKSNEKTIGYPTKNNIYEKIEKWDNDVLIKIANNDNKVWAYNEDENLYYKTSYDPNYNGDYYLYYSVIPGTGLIKDIEDLNYKYNENSKLLYKLNIKNNDTSYLNLYLEPFSYTNNISRTIKGGIVESLVDLDLGDISKGVITNNSLVNSFTYVFNWEILSN